MIEDEDKVDEVEIDDEDVDIDDIEDEIVDPEIERQALADGWKPKEDWKGHPDAWKPADEYVRVGQTVLPIIQSRLKKSYSKIDELEQELARQGTDFDERTERLNRMHAVALDRQKAQITESFGDKKRAAVAEGNVDAYDEADKAEREALETLEEDVKKAEPEKKKTDDPYADVPADVKEAFQEWVADNQWFMNDNVLGAYAGDVQQRMMRDTPGMSIKEVLQETTRLTREKFPEKFGRPNGKRRPSVEGGSRRGGNTDTRGEHDLPPEALKEAREYIKEGVFKTVGDYAKMYFKQPGT